MSLLEAHKAENVFVTCISLNKFCNFEPFSPRVGGGADAEICVSSPSHHNMRWCYYRTCNSPTAPWVPLSPSPRFLTVCGINALKILFLTNSCVGVEHKQTKVQEADGRRVLSRLGTASMPMWLIRQVIIIMSFHTERSWHSQKRPEKLWREWRNTKLRLKSTKGFCICPYLPSKRWLLWELYDLSVTWGTLLIKS